MKYYFECGNAMIDGVTVNDFTDDSEAVDFAADHEATVYRVDNDGNRQLIYDPRDAMD